MLRKLPSCLLGTNPPTPTGRHRRPSLCMLQVSTASPACPLASPVKQVITVHLQVKGLGRIHAAVSVFVSCRRIRQASSSEGLLRRYVAAPVSGVAQQTLNRHLEKQGSLTDYTAAVGATVGFLAPAIDPRRLQQRCNLPLSLPAQVRLGCGWANPSGHAGRPIGEAIVQRIPECATNCTRWLKGARAHAPDHAQYALAFESWNLFLRCLDAT